DRGVLLYYGVERIRLRADHDHSARPDGAALHPFANRLGPARLDDDRGGHIPLPAAGGDLHISAAKTPFARRHLLRYPQMTAEARRGRDMSFKRISARYLEPISQALMIVGIV